MSYHKDLIELKDRFETFIQKLDDKAQELEEETKAIAQKFYDEDEDEHKRSYNQFKMGIEGQFKNIREKVYQVFETKILPLRQGNHYPNVDVWYHEMYDLKNSFETKIWATMNDIFDSVQQISPEVSLQKILDEYEETKNSFHCEQCGANLTLDKIYFVSTYITCPYCQTQNTFVPDSRTQSLQFLSREIAEERMLPLSRKVVQLKTNEASKAEQAKAYNYYRVRVWLEKVSILPDFIDEFSKVYYRELYEYLYNHNIKKIDITPKVYQTLLEQFGFTQESLERLNIAYTEGDERQLGIIFKDWEKLLALSSYIVPQLYQVGQQEGLYNQNFKRIQNTWKFIANLNREIKNGNTILKDAVIKVNKKFK